MSSLPQLSEHDKAILNSLFNPSLPLGEGIFQNDVPLDETEQLSEDTGEEREIKKLEIEAIRLADDKRFDKSQELFQKMISMFPQRATTYNNRAQMYRLMGDINGSLEDLAKAIELSNGKGKTGCQALCQRGIIYRKEGNEQLARKDFQEAAKLGSAFAKQQLVEMNPYAALCNQMLNQVIHKLN